MGVTFHSSLQQNLYECENPRYMRYKAEWTEIKEDDTTLTHIFNPLIDRSTGDLYLECTSKKLWAKFATYTFIQPLMLAAKTVYHLLVPISIPYEIYKAVTAIKKEERTAERVFTASFNAVDNSIRDVIRMPVYAVASVIIGSIGIVLGAVAPHLLYDLRKVAAKLDLSTVHGEGRSSWILFECFQSLGAMQGLRKRYWIIHDEDTEYKNLDNKEWAAYRGVVNFTRTHLRYRRTNCAIFNDWGKKLSADKAYTSPWALTAHNTAKLVTFVDDKPVAQ